MSQLGGSAFSAIKFLDLFFKDVSKLISVVEEEMKKNDLISSSGGASFWEQSTTHYTPEKWMPRYIPAPQ